MKQLLFWLKVSRPGLWFATLWLYMLPTSLSPSIWYTFEFWLGIIYVTFPLNFLVYGWNDMVDQNIDKVNPRKDNFWFGAKGSARQLKKLWIPIIVVQLIFFIPLIRCIGPDMIWLMTGLILINGLYNLPERGLRSRPPFELICQIGYLLIVPLSIELNNTSDLPWQTYLYLLLFAWQSHLMGEVMDIEPDNLAGRQTTATVLGIQKTKILIIFIVIIEVLILMFVFDDLFFGGILLLGLIWLLVDLILIFNAKRYTLFQMKLFGFTSNVVAIISMLYVWYSGCLLQIS